jgi:hypothetical protein
MPINADKPHLWKADTRASVDQFNQWFMKFAPKAYRDTRKKTIESVEQGLTITKDLTMITPEVINSKQSRFFDAIGLYHQCDTVAALIAFGAKVCVSAEKKEPVPGHCSQRVPHALSKGPPTGSTHKPPGT